MVKQCNIYGQSVQLINYGQVWVQKYYHAYEQLYGIPILTPRLVWNSKADKIIKFKYIVNFVADAWATFKTLSIFLQMYGQPSKHDHNVA